MALSSVHAQSLGVEYRGGRPVQVSTASGTARGYRTQLSSVAVGDIAVHELPAIVIEGSFPARVLLGMTYPGHLDLQEQDNILILRQSY